MFKPWLKETNTSWDESTTEHSKGPRNVFVTELLYNQPIPKSFLSSNDCTTNCAYSQPYHLWLTYTAAYKLAECQRKYT